jgi:hypothetical protein
MDTPSRVAVEPGPVGGEGEEISRWPTHGRILAHPTTQSRNMRGPTVRGCDVPHTRGARVCGAASPGDWPANAGRSACPLAHARGSPPTLTSHLPTGRLSCACWRGVRVPPARLGLAIRGFAFRRPTLPRTPWRSSPSMSTVTPCPRSHLPTRICHLAAPPKRTHANARAFHCVHQAFECVPKQ